MPQARISQRVSTAAEDPGMSAALRSLELHDMLWSMPEVPSVACLAGMRVGRRLATESEKKSAPDHPAQVTALFCEGTP
jgi:hypothetical protein